MLYAEHHLQGYSVCMQNGLLPSMCVNFDLASSARFCCSRGRRKTLGELSMAAMEMTSLEQLQAAQKGPIRCPLSCRVCEARVTRAITHARMQSSKASWRSAAERREADSWWLLSLTTAVFAVTLLCSVSSWNPAPAVQPSPLLVCVLSVVSAMLSTPDQARGMQCNRTCSAKWGKLQPL